ncbi:MAG: undecaprenyl/decaprenyl-phosphate alpha-N-acetylglucosaminyl 1-phosphate transferase [Anaerolineae bacterium]|jgi:UDP-GlcNAc:undecaprenyl-phosphate GlcNAc-1-phosphate transferase|nr:undecaprenyl/decaprenyl-phosphate alpha-N-acetylglucosaminyl 1-phosphate transferase [Anaerolineae bacterium]
MTEGIAFSLTFLLSFGLSILLTRLAIALGLRLGVVAVPGGRRKHTGRISKLGIVPVFLAFALTVLVVQALPIPRFDPQEVTRLIGLLLGGLVIFAFGLLDDLYDLSPLKQGIGQILTAGVAIYFQIFIETANNPLTGGQTDWPYLVTVVITMAWLGVSMNTVNFLDGLDGLAAGIAVIASIMLFVHSAFILDPAQISVSLLPLALLGTTMGYLLFNFFPAKIFLGSGAVMLGYLLGCLSIIGGAKMATILMVLGLPLLDFAWQVVNRLRKGRNPMSGDRGHLHFRLHDHGIGQRPIVLSYYAFCAFFGLLTLVLPSSLFKFIALGVMIFLALLGFGLVSRFRQPASPTASAPSVESSS